MAVPGDPLLVNPEKNPKRGTVVYRPRLSEKYQDRTIALICTCFCAVDFSDNRAW